MTDRGMSGIGVVLVLVGLLVLSITVYGMWGIGQARADSSYTGHVVDVVEDKGIIFRPSWVNMKTNPRSSDIQQYCIPPDREEELLPKFYDAMESGDRYTVEYQRPIYVSINDCPSNTAIVTDLRHVNESAT